MSRKLIIILIITIVCAIFCSCLVNILIRKDYSSSRVYIDQSSNLSNQQIAEKLWIQYFEANKLSLFNLGTLEDYKIENIKVYDKDLSSKDNGYAVGNTIIYSIKSVELFGKTLNIDASTGNGTMDNATGWVNSKFLFFNVDKSKDLLGREFYYIDRVATGP